jgi:flagellar assembly factor FliW
VLKEKIEESVANLKSPIVINVRTRQAKQIILENNNYPIRCKLFPNLK